MDVQEVSGPVVADMHGGHTGDRIEDANLGQKSLAARRLPDLVQFLYLLDDDRDDLLIKA
jgi:hypothetical protein